MFLRFHIGGTDYRPAIVHLHRRFFYHGGNHMHRHPAYHFILVSQGDCELLQPGLGPIPCPLHSLIVINPEFEHDFRTGHEGVEHSSIVFRLEDQYGHSCTEQLRRFFDPAAPAERCRVIPLSEPEADSFLARLNLAIALSETGGFAAECAVAELLTHCLRSACPEHFESPGRGRKEKLAAAVRLLIEQSLRTPDCSLARLARQLHLHPNHLNAVFREIEHLPIGEYLIRRRLQRATEMLAAGNRPKETAFACGFQSQNYFCRLFRQRLGCSPSDYQNRSEGI